MIPLGAIVEPADLLRVVLASLVAGVGVTAIFSFAILGASRAVELGRDERPLAAGAAGVAAAVAIGGCVAAIAYGVHLLISG